MSTPDQLPEWCFNRPSTTVVGSFKPEVIAGPGYRTAGGPSRQDAAGSVTTTIEERLALCGFPEGFQVEGSKAKALQVGNTVPPPVAQAVLEGLWS